MRLIDADALKKEIRENDPFGGMNYEWYIDHAPTIDTASPWHRVEEPPKENGAYAVCWKGSNSWGKLFYCGEWLATPGTPFPDYWMPIEPPKGV